MKIERMGPGDFGRVIEAAHVFDNLPQAEAVRRFLAEPNHHLFIAYSDDGPVGFISGVELTHPDKGTEMFLYELGVDDSHQRQGFGTALVEALADLARERGCYGMWVLTEEDNVAARATYSKARGEAEGTPLIFNWRFV
ncbi:MAG TPA: GNAT family N-acetyltransferase [Candidatus Dormibacteraeota bacterium]